MASRRGRIILVVMALVAVAGLWRSVAVEREKRQIAEAYKQAQQMVSQLGEERTQLSRELTNSRKTVELQTNDMKTLQAELQRVQDRLDQTVVELASLQRQHEQLRQHDESLNAQLSSVMTEKQQLEAKLSDIKQLKLAIRDVKRKMHEERWQVWLAHVKAQREEDQRKLAAGNRGYLVRDGLPTLGASRKLQVHVLEPQSAQ